MAVNVALQRAKALRAPREAAAIETQTARLLKARSKERCFVSVQVCGVGGHLALHLGQPDWQSDLQDASCVRTPSPMKIDDLTGGDTRHLLSERERASHSERQGWLRHSDTLTVKPTTCCRAQSLLISRSQRWYWISQGFHNQWTICRAKHLLASHRLGQHGNEGTHEASHVWPPRRNPTQAVCCVDKTTVRIFLGSTVEHQSQRPVRLQRPMALVSGTGKTKRYSQA